MTNTTPAPYIDETGIHVQDFDAYKTFLEGQYRTTYGNDIVLTPDTQDGQIIGVFSLCLTETAAAVASAYASRSPKDAKGVGLSSLVKLNGIGREAASYSTADLTLIGQAGTKIIYGTAVDQNGFVWGLPLTVTIPDEGQITVTGTCQTIGAIAATEGTITSIGTTTQGWQTVTNNADATVGAAVETDAALKLRQADASGLPSQTSLDGLLAGIANIAGITRWKPYVNDKGYVDGNGIPGHSIAIVVDGGTISDIANVLYLKKGQGISYFGDTTQVITDAFGLPHTMAFSRSRTVDIAWTVRVKPLEGFTYSTMGDIQTALMNYTNTFGIRQQVMPGRAFSIVNAVSDTFELVAVEASRNSAMPKQETVDIAYNERAICSVLANIQVLVLKQNEVPGL